MAAVLEPQYYRITLVDPAKRQELEVGPIPVLPGVSVDRYKVIHCPDNAWPVLQEVFALLGLQYSIKRCGAQQNYALPEILNPAELNDLALDCLARTDYQLRAILHCANRQGSLLTISCGGGKTLVAFAWALALAGPILYVTKAAAKFTTRDEIQKWLRPNVTYRILSGETPSELDPSVRIHIIGGETIHAWEAELEKLRPVSLVLDESHKFQNRRRYTRVYLSEEEATAYERGHRQFGPHEFMKRDVLPPGAEAWEVGQPMLFTPLKTRAATAARLSKLCKRRLVMSVAETTQIELRGGVFGAGWIGEIAAAFVRLSAEYRIEPEGDYSIIRPQAVWARGFDGGQFCWKPLRAIISHKGTGPEVRLRVMGRDVRVTEDHSVYAIESGRKVKPKRRGLKMKAEAALSLSAAAQLSRISTLLMDDGAGWDDGMTEPQIDVLAAAVAARLDAFAAIALDGIPRTALGINSADWHNYTGKIRGLFGSYLPAAVALQYRDQLPQPHKIYCVEKNRGWLAPTLRLSEFAYVLGYWIGNGWFEDGNGGFGFSVRSYQVDSFLARLAAIESVGWTPRVKSKRSSKCMQIEVSNQILRAVVQRWFPRATTAPTKYIPSEWIMSWPATARRELLDGLIDSDGSIVTTGGAGIQYTTTSSRLACDLVVLLRSLGYAPHQTVRPPRTGGSIDGRLVEGKLSSYRVDWVMRDHPEHRKKNLRAVGVRFEHNDLRFSEVSPARIERALPPSGQVYDLEMDGHPSFCADGVLVHNSATPIPDRVRNLWAQLDTAEPRAWGGSQGWLVRYAGGRMGAFGGIEAIGRTHEVELKKRLDVTQFVVTKAEANKDLPPLRRSILRLKPEQLDRAAGGFPEALKKAKSLGERRELLLMQTASRKRSYVVDSLLKPLIDAGQKALVLTGRRRDADQLGDRVRAALGEQLGANLWVGHGDTAGEVRHEMVRAYMAATGPAVLIGTVDAFGESYQLQDTDALILPMLPYEPWKLLQAEGRINRKGQLRPAIVYYLVAEGTLDDSVAAHLLEKLPAIENLTGDTEARGILEALRGCEEQILQDLANQIAKSLTEESDLEREAEAAQTAAQQNLETGRGGS